MTVELEWVDGSRATWNGLEWTSTHSAYTVEILEMLRQRSSLSALTLDLEYWDAYEVALQVGATVTTEAPSDAPELAEDVLEDEDEEPSALGGPV
jgi:hypothetical protein